MSAFSSIPLGGYDSRPNRGFTSSLLATLNASRVKVERWVQHEKTKADAIAEEYRKQFSREQAQIDTKVTTLLALQLERGLAVSSERDDKDISDSIAVRKSALEEQRSSLESELEKLREEYTSREKRVQEISIEEKEQRERALQARALKAKVEEAKKTTVDDLTKGVVNYKFTGLDFEKTNVENELRFIFTNLDPENPTQKFSFLLQVNENDKYDITDCQPTVDVSLLVELANVLNETDDMSYLVRRMRRAFVEQLPKNSL